MPLTDLSLADCRDYRPELPFPDGFDAFWSSTLSEAPAGGPVPKPVFAPVDTGLTQFHRYDVTLPGFAGHPAAAGCTCRPGPPNLSAAWSSSSGTGVAAASRTRTRSGRPPVTHT